MNNSDYSRLWRIHKTIYEMLDDRGYNVNKDLLDLDMLNWIKKYESKNEISRKNIGFKIPNKSGKFIHISFNDDFFGIQYLENIIQELDNDNDNHAIIVINEPIHKISNNIVNLINTSKFNIEVFQEKHLLFNITKHSIVPKHSVISNSQKIKLLKTFRITDSQLPRILLSDPIVRYYGLKKGQVVKIIRPSETAGEYIHYRLVY